MNIEEANSPDISIESTNIDANGFQESLELRNETALENTLSDNRKSDVLAVGQSTEKVCDNDFKDADNNLAMMIHNDFLIENHCVTHDSTIILNDHKKVDNFLKYSENDHHNGPAKSIDDRIKSDNCVQCSIKDAEIRRLKFELNKLRGETSIKKKTVEKDNSAISSGEKSIEKPKKKPVDEDNAESSTILSSGEKSMEKPKKTQIKNDTNELSPVSPSEKLNEKPKKSPAKKVSPVLAAVTKSPKLQKEELEYQNVPFLEVDSDLIPWPTGSGTLISSY